VTRTAEIPAPARETEAQARQLAGRWGHSLSAGRVVRQRWLVCCCRWCELVVAVALDGTALRWIGASIASLCPQEEGY